MWLSERVLESGKCAIGWIDGQFGSSGKGKFNAILALNEHPDFAISNNTCNSSHIVEYDDGKRVKFRNLPTSCVYPGCRVIIGPGSTIDLKSFFEELKEFPHVKDKLYIHPNAMIIIDDDIQNEQKNLKSIASTMTGTASALCKKVMRSSNAKLAKHTPELKKYIRDTNGLVHYWLRQGMCGIIEVSQGFDLSIDHSMLDTTLGGDVTSGWPYTTSRNIDPLTFAGMSGIARNQIGKILMCIRTFPIRVGDGSNCSNDGLSGVDISNSHSGDHYQDQKEIDWDYIIKYSRSNIPIREMTSLTKRLRRVFSFSIEQLIKSTMVVQPDIIAINFINYLDARVYEGYGTYNELELERNWPSINYFVKLIEDNQYWKGTDFHAKIKLLGTGPKNNAFIIIND